MSAAARTGAGRRGDPGERELVIDKLVAGGDGLGFSEGKAVFISGVLPGERVRARIVESRRDFDRASLIEVLTPSADRVTPPCALAGICGGCDWLHIRYEAQLAQKAGIVREALRRVGRIDWSEIGVEAGPPLGYRNRVQIHLGSGGRLGYKGKASTRVVPVASCPIADRGINRIFDGRVEAPRQLDRFTVYSSGDALVREGIDDQRDMLVRVLGKEIAFSVGCFFQSNLTVLEKLVPFALQGLSGAAAADLYCGVGLFGSFLSDRFPRVIAVESSSTAAGYARRNVPSPAGEVYPMSVEQWIASAAHGGPLDAVVVDPPRAGLGAEVRAWLCAAAPKRLAYVSCDPVTLARDLGQLVAGGFVLEEVRVFDFYPQTSHVESAARLRFAGRLSGP